MKEKQLYHKNMLLITIYILLMLVLITYYAFRKNIQMS